MRSVFVSAPSSPRPLAHSVRRASVAGRSRRWPLTLSSALFVVLLAPPETAQVGTVRSVQKISDESGGFGGDLDPYDVLGGSVATLGDLDGDGVTDLAVGADRDDDGGEDQGAVWILLLNANGKVKCEQKISETAGGFRGDLDRFDWFGHSLGGLGDLDGDGISDLAVGAVNDGDGGGVKGAVWILFLNADGTVKSEQKISETAGGFAGGQFPGARFGCSPSSLGDLDGDGVTDLAVGAMSDNDTFVREGAVWILFLYADGTVKSQQKINETTGGFGGDLTSYGKFGFATASLGDLDGDGITELAVGAYGDREASITRGAVWILFLNADGTVKAEQKISPSAGGFGGILRPGAAFGFSTSSLGDLDQDGVPDLAVGSDIYYDNGGAVWILLLNADGTVKSERKITTAVRGFNGTLDPGDSFGSSLSMLGDLNGDRVTDLAVGAFRDDDGGIQQGAVWLVLLGGPRAPTARLFEDGGPGPVIQPAPPASLRSPESEPRGIPRHGRVTPRDGKGLNPTVFASASTPTIGEPWTVIVDASRHPWAATTWVMVSERAGGGETTAWGELLVDAEAGAVIAQSAAPVSAAAASTHALVIPNDPVLCGRSLYAQAVILGRRPQLTNALELVIGR